MAPRPQNKIPTSRQSTDVTIFQWNANSISARKIELTHYLSQTKNPPDIICIQETHLSPGKEF